MKKFLLRLYIVTWIFILLLSLGGCGAAEEGASKKDLNLDGYELVFFDDFSGDSLNQDIWEYRKNGPRRGGMNHPDQVRVENGNLIFTAEYTENTDGEAWYAGMIRTKESYTYGYYEIR